MFGGFEQKPHLDNKKRFPNTDVAGLEREMTSGTIKRQHVESEQSESDDSIKDAIIDEVDEMIKVKDVENSTLKIGYNEDDYEVKTHQWENCMWEYIIPKGYVRAEKFVRPKEMDKQYKFKLDKFQDKAIECIQKNESVLVAAHTSAGKTAIAEYAIAKSLKNN